MAYVWLGVWFISCFHSFSVFPRLSVCVCEWAWSSGSGSSTPAADQLISPPCLHTCHQLTNYHAQHKDLCLLTTKHHIALFVSVLLFRFVSNRYLILFLTPKITPFFSILTINLLKQTKTKSKTFSFPRQESDFIYRTFFPVYFGFWSPPHHMCTHLNFSPFQLGVMISLPVTDEKVLKNVFRFNTNWTMSWFSLLVR